MTGMVRLVAVLKIVKERHRRMVGMQPKSVIPDNWDSIPFSWTVVFSYQPPTELVIYRPVINDHYDRTWVQIRLWAKGRPGAEAPGLNPCAEIG